MGQKEKLIQRLRSKPKNFTFAQTKAKQAVPESCLQATNMEAYCSINRIHKKS